MKIIKFRNGDKEPSPVSTEFVGEKGETEDDKRGFIN